MSDKPAAPAAVPRSPTARLRATIASGVRNLTTGGPALDYSSPPGDTGLFGPDSVCWKVHADFTSMMVGGISALLLQALHPLALAGVWDHSTFRTDIAGRLRRTATFIAGTTFGNGADARQLLARVRQIHSGVNGVAPDGRPYAASDPALLTWVHVAEVSSFLAAYLRYVDSGLSGADQDRYFAETALIADGLGAHDVPQSRAAIAAYLQAMRPQLESSERTREVVRVLMNVAPPHALLRPVGRLLLGAGSDLLPAWAQRMLDLHYLAPLRAGVVRTGVRTMAPVLRWALTNSVSKRARQRVLAGAEARMHRAD